ncbi:conserved hypothetical protein [Frankia canadensis]|uniref:Uncharacterized protein n=1 Tax=Frankia canadensis TaxID=1836972 RepID=A0A2I2KUU5_9ACTN|nr:hypothetical protein [Frankia canadensis]SNQ49435.1 conserved hypothetical protein [Frankia canadensis]SOU56725.1 conserved hypothetical protein [Frankia canadensis]
MFDLLGLRPHPRIAHQDHHASRTQVHSPLGGAEARPRPVPAASTAPASSSASGAPCLPPSVARVAARTRLSAELLAAILTVDGRSRATLDDMERADALADVLLARRRQRVGAHRTEFSTNRPAAVRVAVR